MGSCSSAAGGAIAADAQGSITENGHGRSHPSDKAPMWVLKVEHVLAMTGQLRPHQVLKDQGLLEIWARTMFTIFVSHHWLGLNHPDPNGTKLQVLQGRRLLLVGVVLLVIVVVLVGMVKMLKLVGRSCRIFVVVFVPAVIIVVVVVVVVVADFALVDVFVVVVAAVIVVVVLMWC